VTARAATGVDLAALRARLAAAPDAALLRPIGLRQIVTGLEALPAVLADLTGAPGPVALLVDATPMRRGRLDLKPMVSDLLARAGHDVRIVRAGPDDGQVHADERTVRAVRDAVAGSAALVTVASGTLSDIGKTVAAALGALPHVIVQTAASVNGYADSQSVLLRDGVKRTVPSRWPDALVLDPETLAAAPVAMTRAGLGDLASMFTAPADWYLAGAVGHDPNYSPTAVALGRDLGDELLALAPELRGNDPDAVVRLARMLAVSGISMGVADRTAPSSGMEHTVSHLLDMAAGSAGRPTALHGAQVGVSTVLAALTWQHIRDRIARDGPHFRFPAPDKMRERVDAAFNQLDPSGAMARECWADYHRKLSRWNSGPAVAAGFAARWSEHEPALDGLLVDPARLVEALRAAGAPVRFAELEPAAPAEVARWAVANCHLMRDRFTVADLAWFLDAWGPDDVDAVLSAAAALGAGL
jgi:glycerol-1-phosphate dehydrogenase [NAD(P)+]